MGSALGTSPGRLVETDAGGNIIHEWPEDVDGTVSSAVSISLTVANLLCSSTFLESSSAPTVSALTGTTT